MKKQTSILATLVLLLGCLLSCKTLPQDNQSIVYFMVYDYENNAVKDVSIAIDNVNVGRTDVYGRFVTQLPIDCSNHQISIFKEGYETITLTETTENQMVFYFKIGTANYYAELAEQLLDQGKYESARESIDKALKITERKDYLYLQKVITEVNNK